MNKDNNFSIWFFKIGTILIIVWYFLLLYNFPYYTASFLDDEIMSIVVISIKFLGFIILITSFAVFTVRVIRSISYGHLKDNEQPFLDRNFYLKAEQYYIYQIRLLASLSFLNFVVRAHPEIRIIILILVMVIIIVMNSMFKLLFKRTGNLTAPRWSPTPWIAMAISMSALTNIVVNFKEAIEYLKQSFMMLLALFTGVEKKMSEEVVLMVFIYLVVLIVSGFTSYLRYQDVIKDFRNLINLIKKKFSKNEV
ncbi:MAG: hypothetical protein KAJ62_07070 [Desulfobacteraceae bacterium]|nr:hypothetical protein [Desulfobacteraceae bacterium]